MKKVLLTALLVSATMLLSGNALADRDLKLSGTVSSVDKNTKVFAVKDTDDVIVNVIVTPATSIEFKHRFMEKAQFQDLEIGQYVKVEYTLNNSKKIIAEEVKIYTKSNN